jgi:methylmalonyl-CoA mutase C-terminal domain/subunit
MERKIKVIITKIGLDAHTRGTRLIAEALRNAGMEVIDLGHYIWPEEITEAAKKNDVDVIGISTLAANYELIYELIRLAKAKGIGDKQVIVGGTIARQHAEKLKEGGVNEVFLPGTEMQTIVDYIQSHVNNKS